MFGFRQKLLLGFSVMLSILLIVSVLGVVVLRAHRTELDKFLVENWRSVEYGQNIVAAVEHLNDLARPLDGTNEPPTAQSLASVADAARPFLDQFDKNLLLEDGNITLPGERELAERLTVLGAGKDLQGVPQSTPSYLSTYRLLLSPNLTGPDRRTTYAELTKLTPQVRAEAGAIVQLNLANMTPVEGRIKEMADRASMLMLGLCVAGVAMSVLFTVIFGRTLLRPIQALTASAREIEQGNLDLVVQVRSHDELRQLAEAFNSMAAKLREYRRTNRAKLVRTQQTTQNAINSLPDAVAMLGPDGSVEMANTAAQRLFGLRPDAHVNELKVEWLSDLWRRTTQEHKAVEPRGYESAIQVLDEGGGEKFFLPRAVPIFEDDHRTLIGVTIVLADVTHLRRLDEMKSSMLSVVSHELKTPLTSIRMGVHLLLEERVGSLTGQQNDLLVAVRDDSDRLHHIVENLLDMGRMESGRALMDLKPVSVQQLLDDVTAPLTPAFHDHGVELNLDVMEDTPAVMVDTTRIGHVFSNLLGNALKYTAPGGRVRVGAVAEDGMVRFSVEDTGVGIPRGDIDRIFDRFYRVPGQSGGSGAGLGLAIAKEIVAAHGGQIRAESTPGKGTTFSFTLQSADDPTPRAVASELMTHVPRDLTGRGHHNGEEVEHVAAHSDR